VLDIVRLTARKDAKFSTYSLGMKQRLAIANALLGNPKVLLLDEPTNGLDPEGIAEIRNLILDLHQQGITVIMASHLLDEVEKVCNHVAVLKKGNLLVSGPVSEVFQHEDQLEIAGPDLQKLKAIVSNMSGVQAVQSLAGVLRLSLNENTSAFDVNNYCFQQGVTLHHLYMRKKSLESQFMELTKTANPE
jgi:ABC-type multidrug transport system ATPase subunit